MEYWWQTAPRHAAFANQAFAKTSGPGLCFANGYFSAQYAPVVDSSQADSPAVFVNEMNNKQMTNC